MPEAWTKPDILADPNFQNFMKRQKMLVEGDSSPEDWEVTFGRRSAIGDVIWPIIRETPGFMVSSRRLAQLIHGATDKSDLYAIFSAGKHLRTKIRTPDSLMVKVIGMGFNLESLNPSSEEVLLPMYCLWQDIGRFVSSEVLSLRLFGNQDQRQVKESLYRFGRLDRAINPFGVRVEGVDINNQRFFRLKVDEETEDKVEEEKKKVNVFRGPFEKGYQDWMVQAGIIEQDADFKKISFKNGERVSEKQRKTVGILAKNAGYHIPEDVMGRVFYKNSFPDNWHQRLLWILNDIRAKSTNPNHLYSSNLGWAVGIKEVKLAPRKIRQLYRLWTNEGEFVPAELLDAEGIPFKGESALEVRKVLAQKDYVIGSRRIEGKLEYMLIHQSELVTSEAAKEAI